MEPDTGSKVLYPSFNSPLPLPVQDPDGEPSISINIACSWLPYVRGALYQLTQQWSWPQESLADRALAQARAQTLIAMFEECETPIPPIYCGYNFQVSDTGWTPVTPYTTAAYSPGNGWTGVFIDGNSKAWAYLERDIATPNTLTHVEFTYAATADGHGPNNFAGIFIDDGSGLVLVTSQTIVAGTTVVVWNGSLDNVSRVRINVNSGDADDVIVISEARYDGLSNNGCE